MNLSNLFSGNVSGVTPSVAQQVKAINEVKSQKEDNISGKFDPSALERGAKALRDIDSSPNAQKAFDITKMQEVTKQKELQVQLENLHLQRENYNLQRAQIEGEENRKTALQKEEQERRTAQYKTQLESELYQKKLEDQQLLNERQLRAQEEQQERLESQRLAREREIEENRRRTLDYQAQLDRETNTQKIKDEFKAKTVNERENVEVHLRMLRAQAAEERQTKTKQLEMVLESAASTMKSLLGDRQKQISLVSMLTLTALGIYSARAGARVVGKLVERRLGRPPLIRETSRFSLTNFDTSLTRKFNSIFKTQENVFENIVLDEEMEMHLNWITNSTLQAKKNGTPFRHLLLHGPPGTGKTLFARTLAKKSGLDYAIMSGGDVGPLGKHAVTEMNKLFDWTRHSRRGMILFIDECEAFLRSGRDGKSQMSEEMRNVLSCFLHHTGHEQHNFVVVLATNVKEILDKAVLDRVDESYEIGLPQSEERKRMLEMFLKKYIFSDALKNKIDCDDHIKSSEFVEYLVEKTAGFSGRQLVKLVLAFQGTVYGSNSKHLTRGLAETVLNWRLSNYHTDLV